MSTPPGSSYRVSNALILAKRRIRRLEDPVRIRFIGSLMAKDPSLQSWLDRRTQRSIGKIQLRKEREAPFFHEYVVFNVRDGGGIFRIDRRQSPKEASPLDCNQKSGVESFDTIEQVTGLDDSLYCKSKPLVEIELDESVNILIEHLLDICRAIHQHPEARFYTLQRYNCYFFAQTIISCVGRRACLPFWNSATLPTQININSNGRYFVILEQWGETHSVQARSRFGGFTSSNAGRYHTNDPITSWVNTFIGEFGVWAFSRTSIDSTKDLVIWKRRLKSVLFEFWERVISATLKGQCCDDPEAFDEFWVDDNWNYLPLSNEFEYTRSFEVLTSSMGSPCGALSWSVISQLFITEYVAEGYTLSYQASSSRDMKSEMSAFFNTEFTPMYNAFKKKVGAHIDGSASAFAIDI